MEEETINSFIIQRFTAEFQFNHIQPISLSNYICSLLWRSKMFSRKEILGPKIMLVYMVAGMLQAS